MPTHGDHVVDAILRQNLSSGLLEHLRELSLRVRDEYTFGGINESRYTSTTEEITTLTCREVRYIVETIVALSDEVKRVHDKTAPDITPRLVPKTKEDMNW